MAKDGLLVIEVPNIASIKARALGQKWNYLRPEEHLYHFTLATLKKILNKTGFKLIYKTSTSFGSGITRIAQAAGIKKSREFLLKYYSFLKPLQKIIHIGAKVAAGNDFMLICARKK